MNVTHLVQGLDFVPCPGAVHVDNTCTVTSRLSAYLCEINNSRSVDATN